MGKRANGEGSVYRQKNGLWAAAVTVGRNAETGKLVRQYVYAATKAAALEKRAALLEAAKGGFAYIDAKKITVKEWVLKWLETYAKPRVRQNTYETYEAAARLHIIPALGSVSLQKLQSNQIQAMINGMAAKPRAAGYAFSVLRMAIRQAQREGLITKNPCLAVYPPVKHKKEVRQLAADEWQRLFAAARQAGLYIPVLLIWATGMRREEVLGLRWPDVSFDTGTIAIVNVVIVTKDGPKFAPPKSKSGYRKITVPPSVMAALRRHKIEQAKEQLAAKAWHDNSLVCCRSDGRPFDPRTFSKLFSELAAEAGVKTTLHGLRHDHATRLFAAGWHPKDVQDRLGHANISMTMDIYTHHVPARQTGIADWLETILPTAQSGQTTKP